MTELSITILPEKPSDDAAIERLVARTFGPGRFARTAYRLREGNPPRLDLSFTAHIGTMLVGSVRLTPISIGTARYRSIDEQCPTSPAKPIALSSLPLPQSHISSSIRTADCP